MTLDRDLLLATIASTTIVLVASSSRQLLIQLIELGSECLELGHDWSIG